MRLSLRWRIALFTAPLLAALAFGSAVLVSRGIERQVQRRLEDDLRRAAAVFEHMLGVRTAELRVAGAAIVRNPRFFASLALPAPSTDPQVRATVSGVAQDFDRLAHADLFEVLDAQGAVIASVGRTDARLAGHEALVRDALLGEATEGVVGSSRGSCLAVVTPVQTGDRIVGALLLGSELGAPLARRLRGMTHAEVTFVTDGRVTASTLAQPADLHAAADAVREAESKRDGGSDAFGVTTIRTDTDAWLTRVGTLSPSTEGPPGHYVLQRSLGEETAFLGQIRRRLYGLGALGAVAVLVAGWLIASHVTAPVQRLVRAAVEMERGRYDYPIEIRSRDEIGYLAMRFDEMRRRQHDLVRGLEETARVKSEFIAVASHELRTPVSVIGGFQQLLRDGALGPITPGQAQALEAIGRSCSVLGRIAEDATRMAQMESERDALALADADVGMLLEGAIRQAREAAPGRHLELAFDVEPGLVSLHADPVRLEQAVSQLVRNGIRFTPDGGRVEVSARRVGGAVEIAVRDTGIGLSEENQRTLFDRGTAVRDSLHHHSSSTLEFNSAGLGLGLALARNVAEAHGGSIRVESVEGRGSTFTLVLPQGGVLPSAA